MQQVNVINMITNKYEAQQKHRLENCGFGKYMYYTI